MKCDYDWTSGFRGEDVRTLWTKTTTAINDGAWVHYKLT